MPKRPRRVYQRRASVARGTAIMEAALKRHASETRAEAQPVDLSGDDVDGPRSQRIHPLRSTHCASKHHPQPDPTTGFLIQHVCK